MTGPYAKKVGHCDDLWTAELAAMIKNPILSDHDMARFLGFIGRPAANGCMPWLGGIGRRGYGRFWHGSGCSIAKTKTASRLAWTIFKGEVIPSSLLACHHCDNPPCVNVEHIFIGTDADNVNDKVSKGRQPTILTPALVHEIRKLRRQGMGPDAISKTIGVTADSAYNVFSGRRWSHLKSTASVASDSVTLGSLKVSDVSAAANRPLPAAAQPFPDIPDCLRRVG